jgi:hypothetical protein
MSCHVVWKICVCVCVCLDFSEGPAGFVISLHLPWSWYYIQDDTESIFEHRTDCCRVPNIVAYQLMLPPPMLCSVCW